MAKLRDVAAFFIALGQDMSEMQMGDAMTNLRLQKMLYFAQGWSLTRLGKPLFEEAIEAWPYGPVVPACYGWYSGFGRNILTSDMPPREVFTAEEYELLLDTWTELSKYSTSQLVTLTHEKGTPWDRAWNHSRSHEISTKAIREFFSKIPLPGTREKLAGISVIEPLYRKDGVPVFAVEGA